MKKGLSTILLFVLITAAAMADVVTLHNGDVEKVGTTTFDGEKFLFDGKQAPRDEVFSLIFDTPKKLAAAPTGGFDSDLLADKDYLLQTAKRVEKEYPDASGIDLIDHGTFQLRSDGSRIYRYHFAGKILKSSNLNWGQRPLGFEEGRSRVRILFERTIMPDGQEVWWDTTDYSITEPSTGAGVFFSYGKILSATFPQVAVGSIVEYVFEKETYNPFDPNFYSPGFYFQDDVPVVESRCTVVLPKDKKLNFKNYNWPKDNDSPKITESDSTRTYEWLVEDMPPLVDEPEMPSRGDVVPRFDASLFPDWNYIYDWLGDLQKARMVATPEIEAKVAEITEGATDLADSIDRIYRWVQREIHYISIKASVSSGQTGHPADLTFQQRYGDCTDKSILLATMLRIIGVEAYPIIIMTNDEDEITRDIPDLSGNHAITLAIVDGKKRFLDATSTTYGYPYFRADDAGVTYVCAICREWGYTTTPPPEDNATHIEIDAKLDKDGTMTADYTASFTGSWEAGYRSYWENQQAERRGSILQDWTSYIIPGAVVTDWALPGVEDPLAPFEEVTKLKVPDYPISAGDLWILKIPSIRREYKFDEVSLDKRQFPIEYTAPKQVSHRIVFDLPAGCEVEYVPEDIALDNDYASYRAGFTQEEGRVVFEDTYRLKKRVVPPKDYAAYKAFCRKIGEYTENQIFLKKSI